MRILPSSTKPGHCRSVRGFVLIEMLMVVALLGLMAAVATLSYSAIWGNLRFKRQADQLVNVFKMAQNAASQSDRRYAVELDFVEKSYTLRESKSIGLTTMDPNEVIIQAGRFNEESFKLEYLVFDDLELDKNSFVSAQELEGVEDLENATLATTFKAGKSGWHNGGLIVILDSDGNPWTIVIHRFAKPVELLEGEWDLESLGLNPKRENEVPF